MAGNSLLESKVCLSFQKGWAHKGLLNIEHTFFSIFAKIEKNVLAAFVFNFQS